MAELSAANREVVDLSVDSSDDDSGDSVGGSGGGGGGIVRPTASHGPAEPEVDNQVCWLL